MAIGVLVLLSLGCVTLGFPRGFGFGAATAAFQIEGGWLAEGKSLSIWDNIGHSGFVSDNSTGDVVDNSYYQYPEDIAIMKAYGIKHYRMSISWPRILPYGTHNSPINPLGIAHYRKQFQMMREAGITPYVTLYHGDLPSYLTIVGQGFTGPDFPADFAYYAEVCFQNFGDLVKHWFTFNEPWCMSVFEDFQPEDVSTKPYRIAHSLLLAHSEAVHVYRTRFQAQQRGYIGWVLNSEMYYPKDPMKQEDVETAERCLAFQVDWFSDPIFTGDYPSTMRQILGDRLPTFTEEQRKKLLHSVDFYAINHYFSMLVEPARAQSIQQSFWDDRNANTSYKSEWNLTDTDWPIVPEGIHDLLMHIHKKWTNGTKLPVFVTENGAALKELNVSSILYDQVRIDFLQRYIGQIERAIQDGVNVTKYFVWSLLDNFEWGSGLSKRFGIVRVEYGPHPVRIPKASLKWYAELIKGQE